MDEQFSLKNPLIIALDVDSADKALSLAQSFSGRVGAFKIGPRLITRFGAGLVKQVAEHAPVFIDCKFLDIPSTMCSAVKACFDAGATLCTIHSWAGIEAMGQLADLEIELNKSRPFKILAVTVLTSFTEELLPPTMVREPISVQVRRLFRLSREAGITGFVSSPHEVSELRNESPNLFFVTPGVRFSEEVGEEVISGDQKRVMSPQEALKNGSSAIVVGRPIVQAQNPSSVFEKYFSALKES